MATVRRVLTRVAVVQLDYHPATLLARRSPLEDPLFRFDALDSLLPQDGVLPDAAAERLKALRGRIRRIYTDQLLARLQPGKKLGDTAGRCCTRTSPAGRAASRAAACC